MAWRGRKDGKRCERASYGCKRDVVPGERFCTQCRARLLRDLEAKGYLENTRTHTNYRWPEAREAISETKYGVGE